MRLISFKEVLNGRARRGQRSGNGLLPPAERAWRILTRPVDEMAEPHAAHTFGLDRPTLRWVHGSQVSDLYVDGMTTEQFLAATGLKLDMHKGGFVLSKRINRIMRPHFVSNFFPFFQEDQLLDWLKDEGELFVQAVETGQVAEAMGRIDRHTTPEEVQAWPLREYFASGGHPMWFRSYVKSLMNQHLKRLNHSTLEKLRLPIPGGRHYVMPAAVGKEYLGLVDPETSGSLGEGEEYSVEVMETAIDRAIANQGALGMYCNALTLNKALYGRLPDKPPAPLEDIIDSAVKTGADLSQVVAWNYVNSQEILERG